MALKPSEYGGEDTDKTLGIQPDPHKPDAVEKLRLIYKSDPTDKEPVDRLEL